MPVLIEDAAYCLDLLRRADRDRYLACLLAPEEHRAAFAALYAFNAEIARVRDVVHEPLPGEIRMQWWIDAIAGDARGSPGANPLARALLATIADHDLPKAAFERYVEARIFDLYDDPMPDRTAFEAYAGATAATLIQLAVLACAPDEASAASDAAGHAGVALAVAGALLLMPVHRPRGQVYLPADLLSATGLDRQALLEATDRGRVSAAVEAFVGLGRDHLDQARRSMQELSAAAFPAFLPVAIAGPVLDRAGRLGADVLSGALRPAQWRRQLWLWRAARRGRV